MIEAARRPQLAAPLPAERGRSGDCQADRPDQDPRGQSLQAEAVDTVSWRRGE